MEFDESEVCWDSLQSFAIIWKPLFQITIIATPCDSLRLIATLCDSLRLLAIIWKPGLRGAELSKNLKTLEAVHCSNLSFDGCSHLIYLILYLIFHFIKEGSPSTRVLQGALH